jgi:L-ascorbate metabolism protein UlaG (beta-lactamase superfamily)
MLRLFRAPLFRRVALALALAISSFISYAIFDAWIPFGSSPTGAHADRVARSPLWRDGSLHNPYEDRLDNLAALSRAASASPDTSPHTPPPVYPLKPSSLKDLPASGLRVTWLGHSTSLVEIDGQRILIDPVWGRRASPLQWLGPQRWYEVPIALKDLPEIDAVLISHDHYDHLDYPTINAIKDWNVKFIVPLGVGAHLRYWGVTDDKIVELDWWEQTQLGDVKITSTPARHFSGRMLLDNNTKGWMGFAMRGPSRSAYYSGDSGMFDEIDEIGSKLGPFDVTLIEVGQYDSSWPDVHFGPEQAVDVHRRVRGDVMMPVHWGTFALAYHAWTEPIERVLAAGHDLPVIIPMAGQPVEPTTRPALNRWWPSIPWTTGAQDPIISSQLTPR